MSGDKRCPRTAAAFYYRRSQSERTTLRLSPIYALSYELPGDAHTWDIDYEPGERPEHVEARAGLAELEGLLRSLSESLVKLEEAVDNAETAIDGWEQLGTPTKMIVPTNLCVSPYALISFATAWLSPNVSNADIEFEKFVREKECEAGERPIRLPVKTNSNTWKPTFHFLSRMSED